jgi:iron-sulfur cluster assembly accessory protein
MISITDNAKKYLTDMVGSSKYAHLAVNGGGCSGFQYKWDIVEDDSLGTVIDDILVLDQYAEMFVIGCTVDYVQEFGGSYLKVVNPNATASCGCGESFAV